MFKLRPYQQEAVDQGVKFFKEDTKNKGAVMVLPTGAGKSLVIANIVLQLEGNTIILQPNKEILEQNVQKIVSYGFNDVAIFSASLGQKNIAKITFATIGSIISQERLYDHFDNIIIDECHLVNHEGGQYKDFIDSTGLKVLGLTATPYRLKQYMTGPMLKFITRVRNGIFQKVIHVTQIKEIADQGFLSPMEYYEIKAIDTKKLQSNTTGQDYTDRSLIKHFDEIDLNGHIISVVERLLTAGRVHILVFVKFVSDAEKVAGLLAQNGIAAAFVSGETKKKEREEILEKFKNGSIQVVVNVGVLTTGFDFPELDTIVMARPTQSLSLYYQMVGRGMRPHQDKENCRIVDMAETKKHFGPVEELTLQNQGGEKRVVRNKKEVLTNVFKSYGR